MFLSQFLILPLVIFLGTWYNPKGVHKSSLDKHTMKKGELMLRNILLLLWPESVEILFEPRGQICIGFIVRAGRSIDDRVEIFVGHDMCAGHEAAQSFWQISLFGNDMCRLVEYIF